MTRRYLRKLHKMLAARISRTTLKEMWSMRGRSEHKEKSWQDSNTIRAYVVREKHWCFLDRNLLASAGKVSLPSSSCADTVETHYRNEEARDFQVSTSCPVYKTRFCGSHSSRYAQRRARRSLWQNQKDDSWGKLCWVLFGSSWKAHERIPLPSIWWCGSMRSYIIWKYVCGTQSVERKRLATQK